MQSSHSLTRTASIVVLSLAAFGPCLGCGMMPNKQLVKCQHDKEKILARALDEQKRAETFEIDNRRINDRLAEAEKQLAQLHDGGSQRFAETKRSPFSTRDSVTSDPPSLRHPLSITAPEEPTANSGGWLPKSSVRPSKPRDSNP